MPEPHERLAALFAGRTDAYGLIHGEACKQPLTDAVWAEHCYGEGSVGVYPLVRHHTKECLRGPTIAPCECVYSVKWGCVDIDEGYDRGLVIARNLQRALHALGVTSWVERTKGKGYHVWVFAQAWLPAQQMSNALRVACDIVGYSPKEVNPKQTSLEPGGLGSYVNVPYAKQWVEAARRVVITGPPEGSVKVSYYGLEAWLSLAEASLNEPAVIAQAAELYKPPAPPKPVVIMTPTWKDGTPNLSALTRKVFDEGPLPDPNTGRVDRSAGLQKLAHLCAADGLTPGETYVLVSNLDARLGKYVGRKDADDRYREIVARAFQ